MPARQARSVAIDFNKRTVFAELDALLGVAVYPDYVEKLQ